MGNRREREWQVTISIRKKGAFCVVSPGGELSMVEDAARLAQELEVLCNSGKKRICIDLTDSPVINSRAIGEIVKFHDRLYSDGGELCILNARNLVLEVLLHTQIDRVVRIIQSESELD